MGEDPTDIYNMFPDRQKNHVEIPLRGPDSDVLPEDCRL
jgi:hypothetical protein